MGRGGAVLCQVQIHRSLGVEGEGGGFASCWAEELFFDEKGAKPFEIFFLPSCVDFFSV